MNAVRLAALVNDLAETEEADIRSLLAASAHELARRKGRTRLAQNLGALVLYVAEVART
jgi:hypothetical protein